MAVIQMSTNAECGLSETSPYEISIVPHARTQVLIRLATKRLRDCERPFTGQLCLRCNRYHSPRRVAANYVHQHVGVAGDEILVPVPRMLGKIARRAGMDHVAAPFKPKNVGWDMITTIRRPVERPTAVLRIQATIGRP